jgi:DNA (cytosine-5)-methyltransferase 1
MLTVGSLFSGIGGIDLGLERAGMRIIWQIEIDPYCRRVLAKHWPDVPRFADVRAVGAANLERVDLVCGGFPCQDISSAGRRAGITGERSGLWFEFLRIVGEIRPQYVLVENVAALFDRGIGDVLGGLATIRYDAEWSVVSACSMGAPHTRERVFILSYPAGSRLEGCLPTNKNDHRACRERRSKSTGSDTGNGATNWWASGTNIRRVAPRVSTRVDRLRGLGNAVVPQVAEYVGRLIVAAEERC